MANPIKRLSIKRSNPIFGSDGFTLTELMVVVAIIAVLGGVAVFSIHFNRKAGVQYAADELFGAIQNARMRAVRENQWCTVAFNSPQPNQYQISLSSEVVDLSKYRGEVTFGNSPNAADPAPAAQLVFTPQGFATTFGNVYLDSGVDNTWYRVETTYAGICRVNRWTGAGWN